MVLSFDNQLKSHIKQFATDLSLFDTDIHGCKQSRVTVRYYILFDRQRSKDSIPPQVLVDSFVPPPHRYFLVFR